MNLDYGGKQPTPHDSFINPKHASLLLGPEPAVMWIGGTVVDCKLKPGDTQHFYFKDGDAPPWYKPNAPKHDRIDPVDGKVLEQGYVDKPKGKKQVLWERGWWKQGMVNKLEEDDGRDMSLSAHHVLASCWDFANETTALMEKLGEVGHPLPPQQRLRREEPRRERAELFALGQPAAEHDPQVRPQDARLPAGVRHRGREH